MKLRRSNYKLFYMLSVALILSSGVFALTMNAGRTYAEDDEVNYSEITGYHYVTIHDSGAKVTIKTEAATVGEVLNRMNIEIDGTDIVDPGLTTEINSDNYHINIYRARPVLVTDGIIKKYLSTASFDSKLVAEEAGFSVYDGDDIEITSSTEDFLETGIASRYTIHHNGGTTITVDEDIEYKEVTRRDPSLSAGKEELVQPGELGRRTITYEVEFKDGVEISRKKVSEVVTKEPVNRIVAVGMKQSSIPANWETCAGWAREAGVSEDDLFVALTIMYKESGCRVDARNASSGAYGIPQALPGDKMSSIAPDWETNPVTQIRWMIGYVNGRYGGWNGAWDWWQAHHWY
ncbi:MAG: G5 domain-containing protein [Candidatus Saccharibacteria bacterium]|nr:G5 domain-containing protein [Candidatus Saccharibacteria bacterium]